MHFFKLLTSPQLVEGLESLLPSHRERIFTPTKTLAMFLSQALHADRSCQRVVNEVECEQWGQVLYRALDCNIQDLTPVMLRLS